MEPRKNSATSALYAVKAADLVGCRYRLRQRVEHPEVGPTSEGVARISRVQAAREKVMSLLPQRPAIGDGRRRAFRRTDLTGPDTELATLEALFDQDHVITGAQLSGWVDGAYVTSEIDVLVRQEDGTYLPVMISNHRVARPSATSTMRYIATHRLGLGQALEARAQQRHHTIDGYRAALAHLLLDQMGLGCPEAAVIGQERERAYLAAVAPYVEAVREALVQPTPTEPRRLKQCATCRFWTLCEPELRAVDEISLVFPGERARVFRDKGIHTVQGAIAAGIGEPSAVARAWRDGVPVLSRVETTSAPRADVEIDIDMEAYLDQGAYLWGAYDGIEYRAFVLWDEVGGEVEAQNFAEFWTWLMDRRQAAYDAGQTFAAYCYAAGGENHWLLSSARRFGVVSEAEIKAFIASDEWIDIFAYVRKQFVGPDGLGLKVVAPVAGYDWEDDIDGEASIALRRAGRLGDLAAREMLLRYNEDDCRATRAVREFLDANAPGVPRI
ncbi:TM0106 family RecB-like putative nuclease [Corynebacterium breve]|uniref:TM0106 family RecB-like putative nuclease n=1 Tax=Corynebacterium breve TaxID=3049799 RepID=A0ABY8VDL9_9CORY|nr:TM0106 family RecB-like putative nuclease [Corynebacterium breve]WIM67559.1 TM0106 family RecB-like putative nuclease [Corynebacterium breve]